jgi:hypothetical protein
MALTRKSLKAMGLTDEQVDSIVEMHTETVDGLKDKLKTAEEKANKLDDVQKELDGLKANTGDDWKSKYEKEHNDFESYKKGITEKETKAAKEKAVKAYFEGKNITGANLDIAMRGCRDEIGAIELDGDKIKDTAALDALVSGTFAGLVVTKSVHGAQTANPPANNGGKSYKTKEEILAIKDRSERQAAIAENHEMFGF